MGDKWPMKEKRTLTLMAILVVVVLTLYFNTISWLIESWTYDLYYSHGFLVSIISIYIFWREKNEMQKLEFKSTSIGIIVIVIALFLHTLGTFWAVEILSAISLIFLIAGLILYIAGKEVFRKLTFPIFFLIYMIPFPLSIFENELQVISASTAVSVLNAIGITASNLGAQVYLENDSFLIGAPCSGLRSLVSLLTLSTLYAYALEGTNVMRALLLIASLPIALISNIFRIVSILIIASKYGSEAALNFFHNFSGLVFFAVAILLLLAVGRCFGRLRFRRIF
jgi:exosortase